MGGGRVTVTWSLGTAAAVSHRNEMMEDSFSTNLALWSVLRTVHPGVVETAVAARDLAVGLQLTLDAVEPAVEQMGVLVAQVFD